MTKLIRPSWHGVKFDFREKKTQIHREFANLPRNLYPALKAKVEKIKQVVVKLYTERVKYLDDFRPKVSENDESDSGKSLRHAFSFLRDGNVRNGLIYLRGAARKIAKEAQLPEVKLPEVKRSSPSPHRSYVILLPFF